MRLCIFIEKEKNVIARAKKNFLNCGVSSCAIQTLMWEGHKHFFDDEVILFFKMLLQMPYTVDQTAHLAATALSVSISGSLGLFSLLPIGENEMREGVVVLVAPGGKTRHFFVC
jgi:hypothetical protein